MDLRAFRTGAVLMLVSACAPSLSPELTDRQPSADDSAHGVPKTEMTWVFFALLRRDELMNVVARCDGLVLIRFLGVRAVSGGSLWAHPIYETVVRFARGSRIPPVLVSNIVKTDDSISWRLTASGSGTTVLSGQDIIFRQRAYCLRHRDGAYLG